MIGYKLLKGKKTIIKKANELKEQINTLIQKSGNRNYDLHIGLKVNSITNNIINYTDYRDANELIRQLQVIFEFLKDNKNEGKKIDLIRIIYPDTLAYRIIDENNKRYGNIEDFGASGDRTGEVIPIVGGFSQMVNVCYDYYYQAEDVKRKLEKEYIGKQFRIELFYNCNLF